MRRREGQETRSGANGSMIIGRQSVKQNSIKKALFMGNTFVWFEDLIAGKEEILSSIIASNFKVESKGYTGDTALLEISLTNLT